MVNNQFTDIPSPGYFFSHRHTHVNTFYNTKLTVTKSIILSSTKAGRLATALSCNLDKGVL